MRQKKTIVNKSRQKKIDMIPIISTVNSEQFSPGLEPCPLSRQGQYSLHQLYNAFVPPSFVGVSWNRLKAEMPDNSKVQSYVDWVDLTTVTYEIFIVQLFGAS